jgi:hypothetical protein
MPPFENGDQPMTSFNPAKFGTSAPEKKSRMWLWLTILVLIILAGIGIWKLFDKGTPATGTETASAQKAADPAAQAAVAKETASLLAAAGKLILLPDEVPTIATILDAKKLVAEQVFYQGAQNGDKLLVFAKAQKAVIYSPSRNVLVNVGPVYFNNAQAAPAPKTKAVGTSTKDN